MEVFKYKKFVESLILEEENADDNSASSTVTYDTDFNDTPENYIRMSIRKIKNTLLKMFKAADVDTDANAEVDSESEVFGTLLSIEDNNYNTHQTIVLKYQDETYMYVVYIKIPLTEALTKDDTKKLSVDSIKNCNIKFKKYVLSDNTLVGEIDRKVKTDDLSKKLLIDLNIDLDKEFGNTSDDLDLQFDSDKEEEEA